MSTAPRIAPNFAKLPELLRPDLMYGTELPGDRKSDKPRQRDSFLIRQSFMRMAVVATPIGFSNIRNCCVRFCVFRLKRCN